MNFDHVNKVADFWRNQILPNVIHRVQVTDFGMYLSRISEGASCHWMRKELRIFAIPYFVNPVEFTKKYKAHCITFLSTNNPQEGSMLIIYQLSPNMHVLARLYNWVEHDVVRSYLTLTCAYRHQEEYQTFFDENKVLRLSGNTEDRMAGFNPLPSPLVGFGGSPVDKSEEELNR